MGVQLPLPAPLIKPISRLFVFTYVSWSLIREARVPDVRYKNGCSAHPINFECQCWLKIPHSAGRKFPHLVVVTVYSFSRLARK